MRQTKTYKNMETRIYEAELGYSFYVELNSFSNGSEWEITLNPNDTGKKEWSGTLKQLINVLLGNEVVKSEATKTVEQMTLEEKEEFALKLLNEVQSERRKRIVNVEKANAVQ